MKKITTILTIVLLQTATLFANNENDTLSKQKQCFYDAKTEIENMLSGKIPLDYERAVFITENAYWNNQADYELFKLVIDLHSINISKLINLELSMNPKTFESTLLETKEQKETKYLNNIKNWAIYKYMTDTTFFFDKKMSVHHLPYSYSVNDPLGTLDWKNSQVFNLLTKNVMRGNCYALTSLYKIFSERLNSDANIGTAPGHIYITHIDQKGTHYNIELASRAFPGAGSIMTLTYTPIEAVRNGIAMRTLDLKQSVALCLIYLAKGYEHKFDAKTDDFLYQCAETTLKYDSLNLNAMLLKAEVLEEKIVNNNKTIAQLQTNKEFKEYQHLIVTLFEKGYREMPLDMKNLIINRLQNDSIGLILTDHTPKGFQTINPKDDRYATLSWGMFDEVHEPKLIEQYGRALLNTKTKKITKFVIADTLYNNYPIDPVVFAWQIDPLASKYPHMSPYAAFNDNPIWYVDLDGREGIVVSGSPGNPNDGGHGNQLHFLVNGLDRAKDAKKHTQRKGEKVTWLIYNDPTSGAGFDSRTLAKYKKEAAKLGINVIEVSSADQIVDYVNEKTGGDSRANDQVTSFYYVGHATPGDLDVGYAGSGDNFDPSDFNSDAFSSGTYVNLVGGCRTAVADWFEDSNVTQFQEILDNKSTIKGSDVRVDYPGGVRTDYQLTHYTDVDGKTVSGNVVERKGELPVK